tara:strand:+ start:4829 stop:5275 length:447 start_codon:yes stop_codon:yes gene_type:complete
MKAGKVWGTTELLEGNNTLEFHRVEMKKGGVSSKHKHEYKWNGWYTESGKAIIRVWQQDYKLVDETIVGPGMYTKVKPGLYHQFECIEDGVAFEIYWAEINHNDVVRETTGYSKNDLNLENQNLYYPLLDSDTLSINIDTSEVTWPKK